MSDSRPHVFALILNWNGAEDTVEAVRSVQKSLYAPLSIMVIDNGSDTESREAIRAGCPDVEMVETGDNLGYAGGNNFGMRIALERGADYCLILNNDLTVAPDMIELLVSAATEAGPGVLGPRVYRYDEPESLFYTGWEIDWKRWLFHRTAVEESAEALLDVDYVQGCAVFLSAEILQSVGMFDERYHLYCEDADLSVRAGRAGFRVAEVMGARAWHKGYGSSGRCSPLKIYYSLRNRLLFISKLAPSRNRLLLRAQLLFFDAGGQALRAFCSGEWQTLRAQMWALWDWLRGHYGAGPGWLFRR